MKKLFTLVALLAVFMGAKAEWVEDYSIDYSTKNNFPFFVMGYVPEWVDGVMTDYGASYRYATQDVLDNGDAQGNGKLEADESIVGTVMAGSTEYQKVTGKTYWHQYFIADGIPTELDGSYTVKAMVKASEAVTINVNMGWGWGQGQSAGASVAIGTEWAEVEWEYSGIGGTSCNMVAQPGTSTATIEWKWVKVSHNATPSRPVVWQQWLTNDGESIIPDVAHTNKYVGDAEFGAWPDWALATTDGINANWRGDRTGEICAWALTMGRNFQPSVINDDSDRARPYPADIESEPGNASNHVFAVHVKNIEPIDDNNPETDDAASIAWSNQFWIQSPKAWPAGTKVKIKFRYKASTACTVGTQVHKQHPSDYLFWNAVGDVNFTTEWQEFEKDLDFSINNDNQGTAGGWSLAFNLNADATNGRTAPIDFYFDDLSWETMVLDEGYFVASANTASGIQYDYNNATAFDEHEYAEDYDYVAVVGGEDEKEWINQVMISTIRGEKGAFMSNTLKPKNQIVKSDPEEWIDYAPASMAKIDLPAAGQWKIYIDTHYKSMAFEQLAGDPIVEPVAEDIITNSEVFTVNAVEREYTADEAKAAGVETPTNPGAPWDNQFFIKSNRVLKEGEVTIIEFDYVATKDAKVTTQCQGAPGDYRGGGCGNPDFTTTEAHFKGEFTVPANENKDIQSMAFNLAEIKDANTYTFKNFKWYMKNETLNAEGQTYENLINATGTDNFYWKIGAGNKVVPYGTDPSGIFDVINDATTRTDVIYNLSGQRVSKDYKGVVIMNGRKVVNK